jgi:hypothetical protein
MAASRAWSVRGRDHLQREAGMSGTIPIAVTSDTFDAGPTAGVVANTKGGMFGAGANVAERVADVPVDKLRESLRSVSTSFLESLSDVSAVGRFRLKEVTVKVEVSAEGGIRLIGSASASAKGAIELKFVEP